jgi:aspartate 1-decarboxylase
MVTNKNLYFKRTAVHNLIVTKSTSFPNGDIKEGLVIPKDLMRLVDIQPFEQIIVTRINGDNWKNRVYSFAIPGQSNDVEARGSLSYFLNKGDLICIIARGCIDIESLKLYLANEIPVIDFGFNPEEDHGNDISNGRMFLELYGERREVKNIPPVFLLHRANIERVILSTLVTGLKVTETYENCLQGSAEIPQIIMEEGKLVKYQGVFVHNLSRGGMSVETYIVPTPPGIVRSTGAMSKFAKKGEEIAISSYKIAIETKEPIILTTKDNIITHKIEAVRYFNLL